MPILTGSTSVQLLLAADLADFAGAPFADSVVLAAGATIRSEAGWHIAPSITETITLDSNGGPYLLLPTLNLTAVTAVRDVTDPDNPVALDGWSAALTARFRAGCLRRTTCWWPCGVLEVDITHGYDLCPQDLLSAAAALCQDATVNKATGAVRLGSLSVSGTGDAVDANGTSVAARIARYTIPPRP